MPYQETSSNQRKSLERVQPLRQISGRSLSTLRDHYSKAPGKASAISAQPSPMQSQHTLLGTAVAQEEVRSNLFDIHFKDINLQSDSS